MPLWASACLASHQRSGRETCIQVDPERCRFRKRIEAGFVDEFEQVLLDRGQGHGGTGGMETGQAPMCRMVG
jgi:hypothetical protein